MTRFNSVIVVGAFAPPIHGQAASLDYITNRIMLEKKINIIKHNTALGSQKRGIFNLQKKVYRYTLLLLRIGYLRLSKAQKIYAVIEGRRGRFLSYVLIITSLFLRYKIYIHFHGYELLLKKYFLLAWLAKRDRLYIILLNEKMEKDFCSVYGSVNTLILPNSPQIPCPVVREIRHTSDQLVVGFLSNLTREKGIVRFMEVAKKLESSGIIFKCAGGFSDDGLREYVLNDMKKLNNFKYEGPLFGCEKKSWYQGLDAFLFLSSYSQEADPLVLYEAAFNGAKIISTNIGSSTYAIQACSGILVNGDDIESIVALLRNLAANPKQMTAARTNTLNSSRILLKKDRVRLDATLKEIFK